MRVIGASVLLLLGSLVVACGPTLPSPGRLPDGKTFTGRWDSNWGLMTLVQSGRHLHGRYAGFRNGSVSGRVDGDLLIFRWTQEESRQFGRGYLQLMPSGNTLEGRWGYQRDRFKGGRWWARRVE